MVSNAGQHGPEMDRSDLLGVLEIVYLIVAQPPLEVARSTGETVQSTDGLSFELTHALFVHRSHKHLKDRLRTLDQRQQDRSRADQLQGSDNQTIVGVISVGRIGLGGGAMQESCVSPKHEPRETCCFECFDPDHGEISCLQCRFRA